jgi:hypothetical protein
MTTVSLVEVEATSICINFTKAGADGGVVGGEAVVITLMKRL